ncbi:Per1-like-domain-containing protein [Cercophora scortea]|uniref:Post-GPI attachment to proteins factor 3 n=1 Tax=Cercophora scortea TaxID=314031 RepID=A0AAE0J5H1_9PEZI|nr:Per1-like-domain-containing protein [Cercophora scortea]
MLILSAGSQVHRRRAPAPALLSSSPLSLLLLVICLAASLFGTPAAASYGDRLPEFQECVKICDRENCGADAQHASPIPLHHRLLLWTCPAECDYTCQHLITARRRAAKPPQPTVQFHGKWPFRRFLGMQEPLSVLFSAGNFMAHYHGLRLIQARVPASYPLRRYYTGFAYLSLTTWVFSFIFHIRDFSLTEQLDYFAAGASVLYGLYYAPVRILRLDKWRAALRVWTTVCVLLYAAHVTYLKMWKWDYSYNMKANVVCGAIQNVLWISFSIARYRSRRRAWAAWGGITVVLVMSAMSLELLDFAPIWGSLDAHSLWHAGTIGPIVLWYK